MNIIKQRFRIIGIIAIIMVMIITISCESPVLNNTGSAPETVKEETATVVINAPGVSSVLRSVMASNLPLQERIAQIASYTIIITDAEGNVEFDNTVKNQEFPLEIPNLSVCKTTFKVAALDSNNKAQAEGAVIKTLIAGKNNIPITLTWMPEEDVEENDVEENGEDDAEVILVIDFDDPPPVNEDKVWIDIENGQKNIEFLSLDTAFDYIEENAVDKANYTVRLGGNRNIGNRQLYYDDKVIHITLISNDGAEKRICGGWGWGGTLIVGKGVTLTLDKGITIVDPISFYFDYNVISVKEKLIMKTGSTIVKENENSWGWIGVVVESTGSFVMDGGAIIGNGRSRTGVIVSGKFTMNNGTISGSSCSIDDWGSGVWVNSGGTFSMNDGLITDNNAYEGGGVYVYRNASFTMNGGQISGNRAGYGGGVYATGNGSFTMNGGTISGNSSSLGGGVCNYYGDSTFTMTGGAITGNSGMGVYILYSNFNKTGGTVSDNTDYAIYAKSNVADQVASMSTTARPEVKLKFTNSEPPFATGHWDNVSLAVCNVTFDATGGNWNGDTANKDITVGLKTTITPPVSPQHSRRNFIGWYTQQSGGSEFDFSTPITTNTTLYARWLFSLPLTHVDDILPYLIAYKPNEYHDPMGFHLPLKINLGDMKEESDWWKILESIYFSSVRVNLDLSACTMDGTDFNRGSQPSEFFYRPGYTWPSYTTNWTVNHVYKSGSWYYITGIILPDTVESLSLQWYRYGSVGGDGPTLKYFSAKNLKSIPTLTFEKNLYGDCSSIEYLNIPAVTSIGRYAFLDCVNLKTIILGPVPPTIEISISAFHNTHPDLEIRVPAASVDAYKAAEYWSLIKERIIGM